MTFNQIISKKLKILEDADDIFVGNIKKLEKQLYDDVIKILLKFVTKNGRFDVSASENQDILLSLKKLLKDSIKSTTFDADVKNFLTNFNKVERYAVQAVSILNDINASIVELSAEKQLAIDFVSSGLLSSKMKEVNIANPIRKILLRHVTSGITIDDSIKELQEFILGDEEKRGFAEAYVRQIATDALNQFDGVINQKMAKELGMDAWKYVGSLIKTSREQCKKWVHMDVLPFDKMEEEIQWAKDFGSGYSKLTPITPDTFAIYRGGHNCRHSAVPTYKDL